MRKGAIVISETVLVAFGVIISFVLLGTFGSMIFSGQSEAADVSALALVAKDIAWRIDDVAAEAGGVALVYNMPKGIKADIHVDYKRVEVAADGKSYAAPFQALTHTKPYVLKNTQYICIVKNQDDMRISLSKDKCICNTADKRCDPACVVSDDCDPACNVDGIEDRVCDRRCSKEGDGICDADCFTNEKDMVNEATDCIDDLEDDDNGYKKSVEEDRICDADSHNVMDYICDIDCLNNGTSFWGICDPDCSKYGMYTDNGIYFSQDGFCDLDCGYIEIGSGIKKLYEDSVCDRDCANAENICDPDCGDIDDDCDSVCVTSCLTSPGCRSGLTNGHTVVGCVCCVTGEECYDCDDGYTWDGLNCVSVPDPTDPADPPVCAATYIIPRDMTFVTPSTFSGVGPGDCLFMEAGVRTGITFKGFRGESGNPILITNQGGLVDIKTSYTYGWAVSFRDCQHIKFSGKGDSSYKYGIKISEANTGGLSGYRKTEYIEIENIEITKTGIGISVKTHDDENGDPVIRSGWTQHDTTIHDCYIHDTHGEGLYLGGSYWNDGITPELDGVYVYNNILENIGFDGIQISSAPYNVEVHHNYIDGSGQSTEGNPPSGANNVAGLLLGIGTTGKWYNNKIINSGGRAIYVSTGPGSFDIYNNLIINTGVMGWDEISDGITIRNNGVCRHNTIINPKNYGIKVLLGTVTARDNIIAGYGDSATFGGDAYKNLESISLDMIGFVNPGANDFHLLSSSSAVNKGSDPGYPAFDLDGSVRPHGLAPDIGAYEYGSAPTDTTDPIVTSFSINPTTVNANNPITASYRVTDNTALKQTELWRTTDSGGVPNNSNWARIKTNVASGTSALGSFTDSISTAGTYWYGIRVIDQAGNIGTEPSSVRVVVISETSSCVNDIYVAAPVTSSTINSAIASARPGDCVIIPDGAYHNVAHQNYPYTNRINVLVSGTSGNEITIKPATVGGVTFTGTFYMRIGEIGEPTQGNYIIVKDFKFENVVSFDPNNVVTKVIHIWGDGVTITNNYFTKISGNGYKTLGFIVKFSDGADDGEISYNTFIDWWSGYSAECDAAKRLYIHHNYFENSNIIDPSTHSGIHLGVDNSDPDLDLIVEYNYFANTYTGAEAIDNKASDSTYRYNVFKGTPEAPASGITLRGGSGCIVDSNYFINVGAATTKSKDAPVRLYGRDHKIINNYIEGATSIAAIHIGAGALNYDNVDNILIANNIIINSKQYGIIAGYTYESDTPPSNLYFYNNIISQSTGTLVGAYPYTGDFKWTNNLHYNQGTATYWKNVGGGNEPAGITHANPNLIQGTYIKRLQASSINAIGKGTPVAIITDDIDGHSRDATNPDIGCDEYSTSAPARLPITEDEVGVSWQ